MASMLPVNHPTSVVYLDESGVIKTDRFFGIGCLKVEGCSFGRSVRLLRNKREYFDEIHWSRLDKAATRDERAFGLALAVIDLFFEDSSVSFHCTVADRNHGDLASGHPSSWEAYEAMSAQVLDTTIGEREIASVLADHVDTPKHVRFEESVTASVNGQRQRLTVATTTRLDSQAVDGLQVADLLLGAAMFDFRQGATKGSLSTDSQKARLCARLLEGCERASFRPRGAKIDSKLTVAMKERKSTRRGRRGGG